MKPYYRSKGITIYNGDCREVLPTLKAGSVDLVMTDPPYLGEFIPLYGDLAREASRILKAGGFCYAYLGAQFLPEVMALMRPHLTWFWLFNIKHSAGAPRMWNKRLMVTSKPVVAFTNGRVSQKDIRWCANDHASESADKAHHKWGQSTGFAVKHIEIRTLPGALVVDPFLGGGTSLVAAQQTGRKAIGIELEEKYCEIAAQHLEGLKVKNAA